MNPWEKYQAPTSTQQADGPWAKYKPADSVTAPTAPEVLSKLEGQDPATLDTTNVPLRLMAKGIPIAGGFIPTSPAVEKAEKDHPMLSAALKGVGSIAAMGSAMAAAPAIFGVSAAAPMIANVGAGMTSGGVIGALDAWARGENKASGAATGALTGGAVAPVGRGIGTVFRTVENLLGTSGKDLLQGYDRKALEWASNAAKADGLTEPQIANMLNTKGAEAFLAEYSPRLMGAASRVASLKGGENKAALIKGFEDRIAPGQQRARVEAGLNDLFGPPVNMTQRTIEDIAERGALAGPLYEQFRSMKIAPTKQVKDFTLALEENLPGVFKEAKEIANLKSLGQGKEISPYMDFFTTGERKAWPTAESWDYVKRAIDTRISKSYANGRPTTTTELLFDLKKRLDDVVSKSSPEAAKIWNEARDTWSTRSKITEARQAGLNAWDNKYTKDQMLEDVTNFTKPERAAYKEGARAALAERMNTTVHGDTRLREQLLSPSNMDKLMYLTSNRTKNPDKFIRELGHEKSYVKSERDLGTSTQNEATKDMAELLSPKDSGILGLIRKAKGTYWPHIAPASMIPTGGIERFLEGRSAKKFETARESLAEMLKHQGTSAQDLARALLQHNPHKGEGYGLATAGVLRALAQPSAPPIPVPFMSQ